jgi:hypothetical protein
MKENFIKTKITCDFCGKEYVKEHKEDEKDVFPYGEGWKYIYTLEGKNEAHNRIKTQDKHFCKTECLTQYLAVIFNEKEEKKRFGGITILM